MRLGTKHGGAIPVDRFIAELGIYFPLPSTES